MKRTSAKRVAALAGVAIGVVTLPTTSSADDGIHAKLNGLIQEFDRSERGFENEELESFYEAEGFQAYLDDYPVGPLANGYRWEPGKGTSFTGPVSGLDIKAPFTDYIPVEKGAVLNEDETYRIGFAYHGSNHPWLVSLADTAVWEANRHPNVDIEVRDATFSDSRMGQFIDTWITKDFDAIVLWPARKAPMGPPVDRAEEAGIPVVSLDRRTASDKISTEVLGNFYANGLQQGLFLNHARGGAGAMILNRKPLGSTADAIRTGAFLEAIGDQDYTILESYHTNSQRKQAFETTRNALQSYDDLDTIFNTGGEEALGALDAAIEAGRLHGDSDEKLTILANDDSREVLQMVAAGKIDMVAPYTPLIGDIGVRVAIKHIGAQAGLNAAPPAQVLTPNLPMITAEEMTIHGIETLTPEEWDYAYGPSPTN